MKKRIVIIGAVAAGPKAACRLKRLRPDWEITMVDQDSLISYGGCGIPYYVSGDVSDESELRATSFHVVRDAAFFDGSKGVQVRTRTRALAIDRKAKTVRVEHLDTGVRRLDGLHQRREAGFHCTENDHGALAHARRASQIAVAGVEHPLDHGPGLDRDARDRMDDRSGVRARPTYARPE